jgi:HAE1 family hydrophobic/amphiphilic exporter-1
MKRHKEMGKSLLQASKDGTKEIALAATASTLTTISVFVPLLYLGGVQGILFRDQALTLSISLLASLAVALFFLPSAAIAITGKRAIHTDLFQQSRWLQRAIHIYENIVNQFLTYKWISFGLILGLLCLVYVLGSMLPKQIMPNTKSNQFSARVSLPTNAAIESTEQAARLLSDYLLAQDSTLTIQVHGGFSDQTNLQLLADEALNRFSITVKANEDSKINHVKTLFINYVQNQWNWTSEYLQEDEIYGSVLAFSNDVVLLSIENRSREGTSPIAEALEQRLKLINSKTKLAKKFPQTQTIIALTLKDEARRLYDIPINSLLSQLQTIDLGLEATQWQQGSEQISVRLKRASQKADLASMPIFWSGQRFRLEQVMHIEEVQSPELFERDRQQAVETYLLNWSLSDWFEHKESLKQTLTEPPFAAYSIFVKGLGMEVDMLLTDLSELILLSILLIYLLLAAQFESWIYPLFMVISVPMAWLGAFGLLVLLGLELSLFSGLGILILTGIAVNDAILKIDFMKRYYQETGDVRQAISQAGQARFRPVIMTSITTILGLFPMLLPLGTNYELSQALAASVVGGMITSTLLTLIIMPLLFYLKEGKS